jgi:hypothetical protein
MGIVVGYTAGFEALCNLTKIGIIALKSLKIDKKACFI